MSCQAFREQPLPYELTAYKLLLLRWHYETETTLPQGLVRYPAAVHVPPSFALAYSQASDFQRGLISFGRLPELAPG